MPKYRLTTYIDGQLLNDRYNIDALMVISCMADDMHDHSNTTNVITFTMKQIS